MKRRRHLTFWQLADLIPPILARLMACSHRRPLTDVEIATASGLTVDEVFLMSHLTTWNTVQLPVMRRFLSGCGIDFCNSKQMDRVKNYLRRHPSWQNLRKSPEWRTRYEPLLKRYFKSITNHQPN